MKKEVNITNYYRLLPVIFCLLLSSHLRAQVTIGANLDPNEGSLLDLKTSDESVNATKGLLLPRVQLTDLNKLYPMFIGNYDDGENAKHVGLTVYNVNQCATEQIPKGVYVWSGSSWEYLGQTDVLAVSDNNDPDWQTNWGTKVVRHQGKEGIYGEFYSAEFGTAGRWMTTNLSAWKYDGNTHSQGTELTLSASNSYSDPYWCYPNGGSDDTGYKENKHVGLFYNWSAATAGKGGADGRGNAIGEGNTVHDPIQGICPSGWHLPSDREWNELEKEIYEHPERYSSYNGNAEFTTQGEWNDDWNSKNDWRPDGSDTESYGKAMKSQCPLPGISWSPNGYSSALADNGFSVLLAGYAEVGGTGGFGGYAYFWSSSSYDVSNAWSRDLSVSDATVSRSKGGRRGLYSVRCKKDDPVPPAPVGTDAFFCTSAAANTVTISATASGQDETVDFYTEESGGTPIVTGNTETTAYTILEALTATKIYYAESRNKITNAVSVTRTPVGAYPYTEALSAITTVADNTATSATPAPPEWAGRVVRHEVKWVNPNDPAQGKIYEEFVSAEFGDAGRWMTTNLSAWKYDGNTHSQGTELTLSASTSDPAPYWCYPNGGSGGADDTGYKENKYVGLLYNWSAATAGKGGADGRGNAIDEGNTVHDQIQGVCPAGWHLPSDMEWNELEAYIYEHAEDFSAYTEAERKAFANNGQWDDTWNTRSGDRPNQSETESYGKAMKSQCPLPGISMSPNGHSSALADNGFSVLLAGNASGGSTDRFGDYAYFWSSSSYYGGGAWWRYLGYGNATVSRNGNVRNYLFSVRCKKN
jgi:uncharacterized protein (TIGR02145 family)